MDRKTLFSLPTISLVGEVDASMVIATTKELKALYATEEKRATILISTTGGKNIYGRTLYEELRLAQDLMDLTIVGIGGVYSAGITIMMAFPRHKRFITKNTVMMFHQSWHTRTPQLFGNLAARKHIMTELETDIASEEIEWEWTHSLIAKGCNRKKKDIEELGIQGHWLTGQDAVDFGLAGELVKE